MGGIKHNSFYLGVVGVTYMGDVSVEVVNTPITSKEGIYYGNYSGDIGLGNGWGTFLVICSRAQGQWATWCLQIAFEWYSYRIGARYTYRSDSYSGWIIL